MQASNYLQIAEVCIVLEIIKTLVFFSLSHLSYQANNDLAKARDLFCNLFLLPQVYNSGVVKILTSLIQSITLFYNLA